jgi:DNA-binding FrmR family transcriptional regulator
VDDTGDIAARLRRIEGQARGIRRMVEEGRPCEEVITQIMSCRAALDKVALSVMADYVQECLVEAESSEDARATISRALNLLLRMSPGLESSGK